VEPLRSNAGSDGDLSFVLFSLAHAECGEEGTVELRLGERRLLGCCPSCAALGTFGSPGRARAHRALQSEKPRGDRTLGYAGVLVCGQCGKYRAGGEMVDQNADNRSNAGPQDRLSQAPRVSDALKKGVYVSVTTWGGREMAGMVCDREQTGLLLDVHEPDSDADGYVFLPWSSVEQVKVRDVAQRRVKFLQS
jgi:hypothetical protein